MLSPAQTPSPRANNSTAARATHVRIQRMTDGCINGGATNTTPEYAREFFFFFNDNVDINKDGCLFLFFIFRGLFRVVEEKNKKKPYRLYLERMKLM